MPGFSSFQPANPKLFFQSQKPGDSRLGEICHPSSEIQKGDIVIGGYPDDQGIVLNGGRPGACLGPDAIRKCLYKTTPSCFFHEHQRIVDLGNLKVKKEENRDLACRHETAKLNVKKILDNKSRWVGMGGGHDYGYPDGAGFLLANKNSSQKPLIINFDAHLDVRPLDQGLSSGTAFYRLLTQRKKELPDFDLFQVGIQRQCNSQTHIEWTQNKGASILFFEDILLSGESPFFYLSKVFAETMVKKRPCFVSVDIDCFSSSQAMGCSQSWPTGFMAADLLAFLALLYQRMDVQVLGIYEVSPPLDLDDRTAKLAAQIIHQFLGPIR